VMRILIAITAWKDNDGKLHSECLIYSRGRVRRGGSNPN
jgi:hypothetical protein